MTIARDGGRYRDNPEIQVLTCRLAAPSANPGIDDMKRQEIYLELLEEDLKWLAACVLLTECSLKAKTSRPTSSYMKLFINPVLSEKASGNQQRPLESNVPCIRLQIQREYTE